MLTMNIIFKTKLFTAVLELFERDLKIFFKIF